MDHPPPPPERQSLHEKNPDNALQKKLQSLERSNIVNPQTLFKKFKDDIISLAKERARTNLPRLTQEINKLEKDLNKTVNDNTMESNKKLLSAAILQERI